MIEVLIIISLGAIFVVVARRLPDVELEEVVAFVPAEPQTEAPKDNVAPEAAVTLEEESDTIDTPLLHACSPLVQSELSDADRLFLEAKYVLAERRYLEVAARDPACVHALNRLGILFLEQTNELTDAESAFRSALRYAPNNGFLLHNLGLTLYRQGKHSEAAKYFDRSVEGGSKLPNRYANLGMCFLALRQYGKAVSALRKALALDKKNERVKEMLEEARKKDDQHRRLLRSVR